MKNETNITKEPLTASKLKLLRQMGRTQRANPINEFMFSNTAAKSNTNFKNMNRGKTPTKPQTARAPIIQLQRLNTIEVIDDIGRTDEKSNEKSKKSSLVKMIKVNDPKNGHKATDQSSTYENKLENLKKDENEVKRLNIWEKDVLFQDMYNDPQFINSKKELECINWKNDIRDSLAKLNLKSNNFYEDIIKSGEREQGSILFQNINITKKKFQFDVFRNNEAHKHAGRTMTAETEGDDMMDKYKTLKQDKNYDNIIRTDYYREIIKEKIKLEMSYTKELNTLAQKIFDHKQKKINLSHEIFEIINHLKDLEKEFHVSS
jgi:hypothetical protein